MENQSRRLMCACVCMCEERFFYALLCECMRACMRVWVCVYVCVW